MKNNTLALVILFIFGACTTTPPPAAPVKTKENLLDLVENQNLERIREIFGLDQNVDSVNDQGQTALQLAAKKNLLDIVVVLLARDADPNKADPEGNTALHFAVEGQSAKVIENLVQKGADIFKRNNKNQSPLQIALGNNGTALGNLMNRDTSIAVDDNGNSALHFAAQYGNLDAMTLIIAKGGDPGKRNKEGDTTLDIALKNSASEKHAACAALLVSKGSPSPKDKQYDYVSGALTPAGAKQALEMGSLPLHYAAARGHLGIAKVLTGLGAVIDARDSAGNTALHRAVENGRLDIASFLLDKGADKDAQDFRNNSALHLALTSPQAVAMSTLLLNAGAKPDVKNNFGNTPIHTAITLGAPEEAVKALLEKGADPNARNKDGNSPLLLSVKDKKNGLTTLLLSFNGNFFAANNENLTPLKEALIQGPNALGVLVNGKNLTARDDNGNTPLHEAVSTAGNSANLSYLLGLGANPNERNKYGDTPLHLAIRGGQTDLCKILLKAKADIFTPNNEPIAPITLLYGQNVTMIKEILTKDILEKRDPAGHTPLFYALWTGYEAPVTLLLELGADPQAKNLQGATVLHEAVKTGKVPLVELFINKGISVSEGDNQGNTPLHYLAQTDAPGVGDLLLKVGARLEQKNKEGRSPLHESVRKGMIKPMNYFISRKALVDTRDNTGRTPLFDAIQLERVELVQGLLAAGAMVQVRDNTGNTPLHRALYARDPELTALLIEKGADLFAENSQGESPVTTALSLGTEKTSRIINSKTVNMANSQGQTILHLTVLKTQEESVLTYVLLLKPGLDERNAQGKTALDLCLDLKKTRFAEILLTKGAGRN